ncbi:hypothetical protein [Nannocystis pusilla]|uniref:Uncharacterized protein n=1 Tax=Nannocystis pusilla TaxID=889268 RepID=A0ABS7TMD6_9BACT|nr:hypothetical protein [Nannocystis pusilla]MBZ5709386.1 hypothetical protein [Nannocystis pusilla]
MAQKTSWSAGQVLAQAEGSIGTTLRVAVANYYKGQDLGTAQAIRKVDTDTEAAALVTAIRQGRVHEVLMVASSAALGVIAGALSQKAVSNTTVGGVPPVTALGAVPTIAGLAAPISLSGRSMLAAGGLSYITGAVIYSMLAPKPEAAP